MRANRRTDRRSDGRGRGRRDPPFAQRCKNAYNIFSAHLSRLPIPQLHICMESGEIDVKQSPSLVCQIGIRPVIQLFRHK